MVVFSCGKCGEALKKSQVEKHYQTRCRSCNVFSCIDCGKDFWGTDYEKHTKCISEEEKYSGKNYVPKPNANKGEVKQQQWIEQVQAAIDKVKANAQLKYVLEKLKEYPNIPRKKTKFENFLSNSLRVHSRQISEVWDLIMTNTQKTSDGKTAEKTDDQSAADAQRTSQLSKTNIDSQSSDAIDNGEVKKLNKRERKEERRKQNQKEEKKHKHMNGVENEHDSEIKNKKKKKKKRKHEEEEEEAIRPEKKQCTEVSGEAQTDGSAEAELDQTLDGEGEESEPQTKRYKTKFDWAGVIEKVLKKKGEISVKKLRKKVLAEYLAQGCTEKSEEKLWSKFDKKLKKNPTFKVLKDRVKLVT